METTFPVKDKATDYELKKIHSLYRIGVGTVVEFYGADEDVPQGWLRLNGSLLSIADYQNLYTVLNKAGHITTVTDTMFKLPTVAGKIIKV